MSLPFKGTLICSENKTSLKMNLFEEQLDSDYTFLSDNEYTSPSFSISIGDETSPKTILNNCKRIK